MKFKNIIPAFIAALSFMVVGCSEEEEVTLLSDVQVSSSTVAIPMDGGSNTITVDATGDWTLEKLVSKKDSLKWLNVSSTNGSAGKSELTFTATKAPDGRAAELLLHCGGKTQRINVIQGIMKPTAATCAQVIAGPNDKSYMVTGVVTAIANTTYGNWYLTDKTGTIYIYGTLDKKGAEKNFSSLGLEEGDEVTVVGPKTTYGTTVELVNVTVLNINKSLIKVDSVHNATLPIEGGLADVFLTCKGQGVSVDIPEDAKNWLGISSIKSAGTNTVVKFNAAANEGGDRSTTITFRTTDGKKEYTSKTTLTQLGAIVQSTVADFNAAAVNSTSYRLTGMISKIDDAATGKFYIKDFSGETYVYKAGDIAAKGLKVGDIVTLVGKRGEYKGTPQVVNGAVESFSTVKVATIADVLAQPDAKDVYYMVTGEVVSIANEAYGNLTLKDASGEIYVYGCYPGYGATGDARKGAVAATGLKVGDQLTMIATKGSYKDTPQLANGFYVSHVSK